MKLRATDTGGQSRRSVRQGELIIGPSQHEGRCTISSSTPRMSTFIKACHVSRAMVGECIDRWIFPIHSRMPGVSAASPKRTSDSAPLPLVVDFSRPLRYLGRG